MSMPWSGSSARCFRSCAAGPAAPSESLSQVPIRTECALLRAPACACLGPIGNLRPLYERARLVVAPTRFAAGLPLKVIEAAAHGVPVVCSTLLAGQLRWRPGGELLAAADAAEYLSPHVSAFGRRRPVRQAIRDAALARVSHEHSVEAFCGTLKRGLSMDLPEYSPHDMR